MKTLFCIIGRSAVGKDTLTNEICRKLQLKKVISHTTRQKRDGEQEGVNYFYSSEQDFFNAIAANNICAQTKIANNYYWTTYDEVLYNDLYVIDPDGLDSLRVNLLNKDIKIISIYITAPTTDTIARAQLRDPSGYKKTLEKMRAEQNMFERFENTKSYDYCVHNTCFICALNQLKTIIEFEKEKNNEI